MKYALVAAFLTLTACSGTVKPMEAEPFVMGALWGAFACGTAGVCVLP